MPEKSVERTVELPNVELSIQLLCFRYSKNEDYILVDTGCVLYLLRHLPSLLPRLEKCAVKLAVLEQTTREVAEHLQKAFKEKETKKASTFGVLSGVENFRRFLENDRIRRIADPKIPEKTQLSYRKFGEDKLLVYTMCEGNFKAIATQDSSLAKKIPKNKFISCQHLLRD